MPRALLFSADAAVVPVMRQLFFDLGLEVEAYHDIFPALEALTSRDFEVIAADWGAGAEAVFLLKTGLELKLDAPYFLAISDRSNAATALRAGANLALKKPIRLQDAKLALMTCDTFLSRMRQWLPVPENEVYTGQPIVQPVSLAQPVEPQPESFELAIVSHSASLPDRSERAQSAWAAIDVTDLRWLATAALVAATFAVYHFRKPEPRADLISTVISSESMGQAYDEAVAETASIYDVGDELAHIKINSQNRRAISRARTVPPPIPPMSVDGDDPANNDAESSTEVQASAQPLPQSLQSPIPRTPDARDTVRAGLSPVVYDTLQPVELNEDAAAKMLVRRIAPAYPLEAVRLGVEGPVVFQARIARDGSIEELKLLRGPILLTRAAYNAVKQWRFRPYLINGEIVEARTQLTVDFRLPVKEAQE